MEIILQPILLDTRDDDVEGLLVLRDNRLLAIVSRLSRHHEDLAGHLYAETVFGGHDGQAGTMFEDEAALIGWAQSLDGSGQMRSSRAGGHASQP